MTSKRRSFVIVIFVLYISSCSFKQNNSQPINQPLLASFISYHSAMGQGNGIIFRIVLPDKLINTYSIDSFYLNEKPMTFKIIKSEKETYLEANYFIGRKSPSYSIEADNKKNLMIDDITDSVILAHKFYPSWLIISQRLIKQRINIPHYQEIIQEAKY